MKNKKEIYSKIRSCAQHLSRLNGDPFNDLTDYLLDILFQRFQLKTGCNPFSINLELARRLVDWATSETYKVILGK